GLTFIFTLGRPNQQDDIGAWFKDVNGNACSAPCLFGITPGLTKYEAGIKAISAHPATKDMQSTVVTNMQDSVGFGNGRFCVLLRRTTDDFVGGIVVSG